MNLSRLMYGATVFASAFLLFAVEPMAAKRLLPVLGGSSAVWVTCLVFFQGALPDMRVENEHGLRVWTDDYSSLLPVMRWGW